MLGYIRPRYQRLVGQLKKIQARLRKDKTFKELIIRMLLFLVLLWKMSGGAANKNVQQTCLSLPSAGAASCSSPYSANQQGARVVTLNTLPFPIVISYLDSYGREHPRFGVPANCKRQFVAAAGSAWRARPVSNREYGTSCQPSSDGLQKRRRPSKSMMRKTSNETRSITSNAAEGKKKEEEEEEPAEFFGIQDAPISSNSAADFFIRADDMTEDGSTVSGRFSSVSQLHSFCSSLQESALKFDEIAAEYDAEQEDKENDQEREEEEDVENEMDFLSNIINTKVNSTDRIRGRSRRGSSGSKPQSLLKRSRVREFVTISSSDMCNAKNTDSDVTRPALFNFNAWAASSGIELDFDFLEKLDLNQSEATSSTSTPPHSSSSSSSRFHPRDGSRSGGGGGGGGSSNQDDDEHVREVLEDNKDADGSSSKDNLLEPSVRRKATLSFKWKTPHGTHPTVRHEGLTFNIKSKIGDFLRPRTLTGKFKRSERCPVCNWDIFNETHKLEVAAEVISVDGGFRPVKLAPCPQCAGEGTLEFSSVFSVDNSTSFRGGVEEGGINHDDHHHRHHSIGKQRLKTNCPSCHGTGTIPLSAEPKIASSEEILPPTCPYCDGKRYIEKERSHVAELPAGIPTQWSTRIEGAGGVAAARLPGEMLVQLDTEIGPPHYKDSWAEDGETIAEVVKLNVTRINILNNATREQPFRSIVFPNHTSVAAASATRAALSLFSVLPFNASWFSSSSSFNGDFGGSFSSSAASGEGGGGGPHLLMKLSISLDEAVNGFRYHIATLRHTYATLRPVALPIMPGDIFIIPGGGLPVHIPGRCTWNNKGVPCSPPPAPRQDDEKKDPMPWETKCDFSGEQANEDCPFDNYRASWKKSYSAYAQACIDLETGSRYPAALPGASALHSMLSGQPIWSPSSQLDKNALSQQHTHLVCQVSKDSSVFDFPHGHLIVQVDVNADSFLLGMRSSDASRSNADDSAATTSPELQVSELIQQIYDRIQRRRQSA